VSEEATKGFTDLRSSIINRTRSLSLAQTLPAEQATVDKEGAKDLSTEEALKESEGVLARLRTEAAKRLKEIEKAEDAADEALLKFGTNIRNFLRDAVSIAPPSDDAKDGSTVLFESKDAQGKRVIHTTRFDAQLHVIHSSLDSFTKDPASVSYFLLERTNENRLKIMSDLDRTQEFLIPNTIN
jgi:seryl-tRNA synthetase